MIESRENFGNSSGVGNHADGSHNFGQISSGYDGWWLIVDTNFETSWAPVDELDGSLGLDGGNRGIDIFGDDITSVEHRAGHIFTMSWVAFSHHGSRFKG